MPSGGRYHTERTVLRIRDCEIGLSIYVKIRVKESLLRSHTWPLTCPGSFGSSLRPGRYPRASHDVRLALVWIDDRQVRLPITVVVSGQDVVLSPHLWHCHANGIPRATWDEIPVLGRTYQAALVGSTDSEIRFSI